MKRNFNLKSLLSLSLLVPSALGLFNACGSVDTISDRDLSPEAAEGTRPDGMDSKVYGSYLVTVDGKSQNYEARVTLRAGGATGTGIKLTAPNRIELDGAAMGLQDTSSNSIKIVPSSYWLNKPAASAQSTAVFKWFQGSKVFTNSMQLAGSVAASLSDNFTVPRDRDLVIPFTGPALQNGERVVVRIWSESRNDPDEAEPISPGFWRQVVMSGQEARMSASDVNAFDRGAATLSISRELESSVSQGHGAGGRMQSTYRGPTVRLNF
jgi:hypothetical protein